MDEFRAIILEGRQAMRVLDRDGKLLLDEPDDGTGGRPEVQRGELRQMLLDSLPAGTVRWGHKVSGVRSLGDGRHEVTFADGTTVVTTCWSARTAPGRGPAAAVRRHARVHRHGRSSRPTCSTPTPGTRRRAKTVGGGSMFALARARGSWRTGRSGDTLHTYVMLSKPLEWFAGIDFTDAAAATARIAREFDGWAPELTALITDGDTAPVLRPSLHAADRAPVGPVPGVTLIGDAAHLSPPNGEGANLAMLDGAELGKAIAAHPDDIEAALTEYEQAMFPRSAAAATASLLLIPSRQLSCCAWAAAGVGRARSGRRQRPFAAMYPAYQPHVPPADFAFTNFAVGVGSSAGSAGSAASQPSFFAARTAAVRASPASVLRSASVTGSRSKYLATVMVLMEVVPPDLSVHLAFTTAALP
jgi:2-polyprenyl-6-methoxyphenol hydroxylase-like FAD-dependent oxidoreductase